MQQMVQKGNMVCEFKRIIDVFIRRFICRFIGTILIMRVITRK